MFRRALIFVAAVALFVSGIGVLALLLNVPSGKEKKALAAIRAEETALARDFDVVVIRSGFQRKAGDSRDIYVPALLVRTANCGERATPRVTLRAKFMKKEGRTFCASANGLPSLRPGETYEIWLKCVESFGFGSVAWGLSLAETTEGMDFEVTLISGSASVAAAKGPLTAMLEF